MGQSKNTTYEVDIDVRRKFSEICEDLHFTKNVAITNLIRWFNDLPVYEQMMIYSGADSAEKQERMFRERVYRAMEAKPEPRSEQQSSHPARHTKHAAGD